MLVSDVMIRNVVTAGADTPLDEVADTLVRERLRAIPVIDSDRRVLGILTDRQVMTHFLPALEDPNVERPDRPRVIREGTVRDVMERTVMCVSESESLGDVVRLMLDKEIERLPVVGNGRLVGFLTRGDIIRRLLGDAREDTQPETDR
ncbi:MAG: HPP family protein [Gemmatimonadota bacterium]